MESLSLLIWKGMWSTTRGFYLHRNPVGRHGKWMFCAALFLAASVLFSPAATNPTTPWLQPGAGTHAAACPLIN